MPGTMPRKVAAAAGARKIASAPKSHKLAEKFPSGMILKDLCKTEWKLGSVIGQGGFGLIYLASEASADKKTENYIVKIEPKDNGPLFCETHFYQRVAKPDYIKEFVSEHRLKYLSIPPYLAAGLETYKSREYRFLVMPRLGTDLQKLLQECGGQFPPQATYAIGLRMIDALQFLHEKEYVHADIKASNILLGFSKGHDIPNEVYLVDFGLAYRYTVGGEHKEYKEDPKRAHDGTIEFTSRDAHKGLAPARRGDLEILGFCMLQWFCGKLPWENKLSDPGYVAKSKESFMDNLPTQLNKCLPDSPLHSGCLQKYFQLVNKLEYHSKPNYNQIRQILRDGLKKSGQDDEWIIGFTQKVSRPFRNRGPCDDPILCENFSGESLGVDDNRNRLLSGNMSSSSEPQHPVSLNIGDFARCALSSSIQNNDLFQFMIAISLTIFVLYILVYILNLILYETD